MANPNIESLVWLWLAKEEVTYGVDPTLALTDAFSPHGAGTIDPEIATVAVAQIRHFRVSSGETVGSAYQKMEWAQLLAGDGNGNDAMLEPGVGKFLRASEMKTTSSIGSGVEIDTWLYEFTTKEAQTSLTIEVYRSVLGSYDAKRIRATGVRLTWDFAIGVDELGIWNFAGCGLYQEDGERTFTPAEIDGISYGSTPEQCDAATGKNIVATLGVVALDVKSVKIKTNRKVNMQQSAIGQFGYAAFTVGADADANFEVELDPLESTNAVWDPWTLMFAHTTQALLIQCDTNNGTRVKFAAPAAQILPPSRTDSDGVQRFGIKLALRDCGGVVDNALSVEFSKVPVA